MIKLTLEPDIVIRIQELANEISDLEEQGFATGRNVKNDMDYIENICAVDSLDSKPYVAHYLRMVTK